MGGFTLKERSLAFYRTCSPPNPLASWPHVVEPHQINLLASTVLRHLQQI